MGHPAMGDFRSPTPQFGLSLLKGIPVYNGLPGVLNSYRGGASIGPYPTPPGPVPEEHPGIGFVSEQTVQGGLTLSLATSRPQPIGIQPSGNLHRSLTG